jgi:hypothetical protein
MQKRARKRDAPRAALRDDTNFRDTKVIQTGRDFRSRASSEEKLVVFTTSKRLFERSSARNWQISAQVCADARFTAEPVQVESKTIAYIHTRRNTKCTKKQTGRDARLGPQVAFPRLTSARCESVCRASEFASDINAIAWPCAASHERFARQHFAAAHRICDHVVKLGQVASG